MVILFHPLSGTIFEAEGGVNTLGQAPLTKFQGGEAYTASKTDQPRRNPATIWPDSANCLHDWHLQKRGPVRIVCNEARSLSKQKRQ